MPAFKDDDYFILQNSDFSKVFVMDLAGSSVNTLTTLKTTSTADCNLSLPGSTTAIPGVATNHTITGSWGFDVATDFRVAAAGPGASYFSLMDVATGFRTGVVQTAAPASDIEITLPRITTALPGYSSLVAGRVPFVSSTAGILTSDADMTFATDTLTVTKIAATTFTGNITISTKNIVTDTTTGTQIGTVGGAAGQKLGFFAATPIVQPLLATGAGATVDNVITALQNLGLVRQT